MKHRKYYLALAAIIIAFIAFLVPAPVSANTTPPGGSNTVYYLGYCQLKCQTSAGHLVVGPSQDTGYGKMVITGFQSVGTNRYKAVYTITNHQPLLAAGQDGANSGGCWPWDNNWGLNSGCWNEPSTWDWGNIFQTVTGGAPGSDNPFNFDRQEKCASGALVGGTFGMATDKGFADLFGFGDILTLIPSGAEAAGGAVGGCIVHLFWSW